MTTSTAPGESVSPRIKLAAILAVSYALRVWLASGGGQLFWPDEYRYSSAQNAAKAIANNQWREAILQLFGHADHVLFRLASLPVALAEFALGSPHPVLVSAYFSLFSVGVIWLVWSISLRAGASDREALWAASYAAASNCLFFYSRHFLPYDVALFELLLALRLGVGRYSATNSVKVGAVVALGILTYNGYWLLGLTILMLHVLYGSGPRSAALSRGYWAIAGFCPVVAVVLAIGCAVSPDLIAAYRSFSGSVNQGDFHLGYRVIAEYLWYSERGLLAIWIVAIGYAFWPAAAPEETRRLKLWLTGCGIVIAGLIVFSDLIPQFMVYGRLTREAVPFLCLAAGLGTARFITRMDAAGMRPAPWLAALTIVIAAVNFSTPLFQVFPDTFTEKAERVIAHQRTQGIGFYRALYSEPLWGKRLDIMLPPHMELMRSPHPMQFRPFQYEGYTAELRKEINANDVAMQVVETPFQQNADSNMWKGYPGPVRIKLQFKPDYWNEEEPLVSAGLKGSGNLIVARYLDPGHMALGLIRSGESEVFSNPIAVDYDKSHEVVLSEGSLLPPQGSPLYSLSPELEALRTRIVIFLDGEVVLSQRVEFRASTPDSVNWGVNSTGALTPQPLLRSPVYAFGAAPLDQVATAVPKLAALRLAKARSPEWQGALGPVRLRFKMAPPTPDVTAEPLLSINGPGTKDVIFVSRVGPDTVRVGFDRMGSGAIVSDPMRLSANGTEELDVSLGSLMPPSNAAIYSRYPTFSSLTGAAYLRFNGVAAVHAAVPFNPAPARWFTLGANTIGSSTYGPNFRGIVSSFSTIGPENFLGIGSKLEALAGSPDLAWSGFTGPIRMGVVFPTGRRGHREPLLSSGSKSASDTLFVQYETDSRVRFGYARSGVPPMLSDSATVVPGTMQELLLSSGALMPPETSKLYQEIPAYAPLRLFVHVGLNGQTMIHEETETHPAGRDSIWVGANPLSELTVDEKFSGSVESLVRAMPNDVFEEGNIAGSLARQGWSGYPGPLEIRMTVPKGLSGEGQPIVTTGRTGIGDVIFLRYEADGMARIGQDHWGSQLLLSDPFKLDTSVLHTIVVSFGGLYPPAESSLDSAQPMMSGKRTKTIVLFDGRPVLDTQKVSHPSTPTQITVGANLIGGTTARSLFSGEMQSIELAPLSSLKTF